MFGKKNKVCKCGVVSGSIGRAKRSDCIGDTVVEIRGVEVSGDDIEKILASINPENDICGEPNSRFGELFAQFVAGAPIKRKSWGGYWKYSYGKILMYGKDGKTTDIKETNDILFTVVNIAMDDWEIATAANCAMLKGVR